MRYINCYHRKEVCDRIRSVKFCLTRDPNISEEDMIRVERSVMGWQGDVLFSRVIDVILVLLVLGILLLK